MRRTAYVPIKLQIAEVDFDRLAACYQKLRWRWTSASGVPNSEQLRLGFARLLRDVKSTSTGNISSGGLNIDAASVWFDREIADEYFAEEKTS